MRQEFRLHPLGCADCANKMQMTMQALPLVQDAKINFGKGTLVLESEKNFNPAEIQGILQRIEPGIIVGQLATQALPFPRSVMLAFALFALAWVVSDRYSPYLFLLSWIMAGHDVLWRSFQNIRRGDIFDENFLMGVATTGALFLREYPEAAAVMLFYQVGEYFQERAVDHSRRSIASMMEVRVEKVQVFRNMVWSLVDPQELNIGERIRIAPGEKLPVDAKVVKGTSTMQTASITGESLPLRVEPGSEVYAGFINGEAEIELKTTRQLQDSAVARILQLVEEASEKKAPTERFITRFSKYYTPAVVLVAILVALLPPLILSESFHPWIYRALVFLVISCPCALVLSIPLGFFAGLGAASRRGVILKGGNYLESLDKANTLVLDKTGTITEGVFHVVATETEDEEQLKRLAGLAESRSHHPIARSICQWSGQRQQEVESFREIPGEGVMAQASFGQIHAGNDRLMRRLGIEKQSTDDTTVHVALNGVWVGTIFLKDRIRPGLQDALAALKKQGVKRQVILSGDQQETVATVAEELGIQEYHGNLLPEDKLRFVEKLKRFKENLVLFVGDGTNDAPVLAVADIGVAMGSLGTDAAMEAADVLLMGEDLEALASGKRIASKTKRIIWQNILFALSFKALILVLGIFGIASMWMAVFADVGVAMLAVLNTLRILK